MFRGVIFGAYISAIAGKKLIQLPQTIGPFYSDKNFNIAKTILKKSEKIFVRDLSFADKLNDLRLDYTLMHDVSFYMQPQPVKVTIPENAVGINVSGLLYFNRFHNLAGKSDKYKELILRLIGIFQSNAIPVALVPHTYNYRQPNNFDDDLCAIKDLYNQLEDKSNIIVIDGNYTAPELKYIISQCDFFIGARMHANFAAIFSGVSVFGLAYSYKFAGAFNRYGLKNNYANITD
jgi:polysaccharide pyruvyl transferase WcaK-like protein